nr:Ig-like domain-containing protein [Corallococcus silvisoli]
MLFASAPRTVIVDRTAPTVTTYLPASNAATVGVHDAIQVTFSEPMNPHSVTEAAVGLKTGAGIAISKSVALSVDGKTLTVTPRNPLVAPDTVSVDLAALVGTLTDLAGNGVPTAPAWTFTVPTWLPLGGAISAVEGKTSAEDVVLKMDRNDQPVIAWTESDGVAKNIYVARWTGTEWLMLGGGLSGLSGAGTDATRPTLLIDATSRPIVAWQEKSSTGDAQHIFARQWSGNEWEALPSIPLETGDYAISAPSMASESNGTLHLYALNSNEGTAEIGHYQLASGSQSWARNALPRPQQSPRVYSFSTSSLGTKTVVAYNFLDLSGTGNGRIGIEVAENDSAPSGNSLLGTAAATPSIALDSNNRPWITWSEAPSGSGAGGSIYWSRWEGTYWTSPRQLDTPATGNTNPVLSMTKGNPYTITWSGILDARRSIFVGRWISGTWQIIPQQLNALPETSAPASGPAASMTTAGRPIVAWTEEDTTSASIYVSHLNN